jgi:Tol biopolymer transport system component
MEYRISVLAADNGRILRTLPNQIDNYGRVRWTPDGSGLVYNSHQGDADNLWLQPLDGSEPRQLTSFTSGGVVGFDLSANGDSLAVATMETVRDVVMFEDYRGQIARALGRARPD